VFAINAAFGVLSGGAPVEASFAFGVPGGSLALALDPLSAFFLVLIAVITPLAAIFGAGYLARHRPGGGTRSASFFFCLLAASMMLVVAARNGVLFLVAWETMTLTSWVLVVFDHDQEAVRSAGRRYLIASQLGGACLVALFTVLGRSAGSLDFAAFAREAPRLDPLSLGVVLALALLGFGTKAGLFPLHVWLPLAHPAAPSHVSAVMSAVMIKMGIYGLVRVPLLVGPAPASFGIAMIVVGAVTAIYGIANAVGQRDFKRALACSSIENMGIVAVGVGLSALAVRLERPAVAVLAASGAILHLAAHMVMKGLLFLGAGAIVSGAHTRDVEKLGGLLRRLPWTGATFVTGAAGLAALPPFAGLIGEWLLLAACFQAAMSFPVDAAVLVILAGLTLVAAGGLAAASFTRLVGIVFLGEPRTGAAKHATEGGASMIVPLLVLAAANLVLGLFPQRAVALLGPVIHQVAGVIGAPAGALGEVLGPLECVARAAAGLVLAVAGVLLVRSIFPGLRGAGRRATWGCGYSRPTSRLEYTGSSFSRPLVGIFASVVKPRTDELRADGIFPQQVRSGLSVPDRVEKGVYEPLFAWIARRLGAVRRFQHGQLNKYVLQIVGALVVGLVWAVAYRWLGPS
jgi:formate hydrogenlyase subunit 3/multisubunit Na+/H+ antiporter MnhD subunit